jgi:hypothetical protein
VAYDWEVLSAGKIDRVRLRPCGNFAISVIISFLLSACARGLTR